LQLSDLISYSFASLQQDLKGHLGLLTQHLSKFSDLKTVADVMEDKDRINDQPVQNLVEAVGRRNNRLEACHEHFIVLQNLVAEVDNLCLKAEEEKRKVEEKHKQGHDALIMTLLVFTSYGIGKSKDELLQMLKPRKVCKQELIFLSFFFFFFWVLPDLEELHKKTIRDTEQHKNRMLQHQLMLTTKIQALEERGGEMERTKSCIIRQMNKSTEIQQFEKGKEEVK
jgi:hypothetical protein